MILIAIVFVASFVIAPLISPRSADGTHLDLPGALGRTVSFLALFAVLAAYFTWCWSRGRATLPMKTWGLHLVGPGGEPIDARRALGRYLACWIGPALAVGVYALFAPYGLGALAWPVAALNWLAALVDPQRRFLHDRVAGTQLVLR